MILVLFVAISISVIIAALAFWIIDRKANPKNKFAKEILRISGGESVYFEGAGTRWKITEWSGEPTIESTLKEGIKRKRPAYRK